MTTTVLSIEGWAVGHDQPLIEGLCLQLHAGQRLAVAGPSGLGKTTLLRSFAVLADPMAGQMTHEGKTPQQWGYPAFRQRVMLVAQRPVLGEGSVEHHLRRAFGFAASRGERYDAKQASEWLAALGLRQDVLSQEASKLSVGQQQRVALVRGLLLGPRVLLLDEPTSALDEAAADQVGALLEQLGQQQGLAALIVTHQPQFIERWCDGVVDLASNAVGNSATADGDAKASAGEAL